MAEWTRIDGTLADGLQMRLYLAEHEGGLWSAALEDDLHRTSEEEFVRRLGKHAPWVRRESRGVSEALGRAAAEVCEYFSGRRLSFDLPIEFRGTPFQLRVWQELRRIPFGATCSYSEIAETIGQPTACRAVGNANGKNRLPLVIPCHRVLAASGKLGGFTGGLGLKRRLLDHEAAVLGKRNAA
ncbi:MAG TPA: methylated-DNA--[protein]-cysteine S-methyltransferase [Bryobacteraceae bacterium]|jgi:O-6-methylguanine DNA methyltransferase|nr:methylated-DNA--[protein]-cysteine S-methyltransferase [Bryobacteraceae bacterium]